MVVGGCFAFGLLYVGGFARCVFDCVLLVWGLLDFEFDCCMLVDVLGLWIGVFVFGFTACFGLGDFGFEWGLWFICLVVC